MSDLLNDYDLAKIVSKTRPGYDGNALYQDQDEVTKALLDTSYPEEIYQVITELMDAYDEDNV